MRRQRHRVALPPLLTRIRVKSVARSTRCPLICQKPLVIHGENDDRVPLANVLRWSERKRSVTLVAGTTISLRARLPVLARVVASHWHSLLVDWQA